MRALRVAAGGVAALTVVSFALGAMQVVGLLPTTRLSWLPPVMIPFMAAAVLTPTAVGLAIALRRPANVIAWILLVGALVIAVGPFDLVLSEGWALQTDRALWPLLYAWPIAVTYVFPNGRLLSPRWRWVAGAGAASFLLFMSFAMLDPSPFWGEDADVPNPLADNGIATWIQDLGLWWVWAVFWAGILGSLFAGALCVHLRLRRSTGIERLQTMWLAWAAALIPLGLLMCGASSWLFGDSILDWILFPFLLLMQAAVAAAIWIAVFRYRLYAIERLVNRTLVYTVLTATLAAAYVGITVVLGVALGRSSGWVTAAATLAVALAFRPLRRLVQNAVDRRYSRARYDALRQVQAFEEEVREGRRAPEEVGGVLARALSDPVAELLFWLPESEAFADASGEIVERLPDDGRARSEIERDGARTAVLLHDPALREQRELLRGVLAAAALSVEIARLRVELRRQLAEVQASRVRIVEAGYEERRRLERDLHDGAQQRLVSLGLRLRRMQRSLPPEAGVLSPALDQVVGEVGAAISDLRQIAAGVRPARLDDGLAAALRDLARTAPLPVAVEAPIERVAASVEAAAYYVACEALTNAVKHASASAVALRARRDNGTLVLTVSDDGVGGAVARRGSGLAGLQDRVSAHGGTVRIVSPRGGGTHVEVSIPCES
ncbi:MAG TPA: histidine kinase [Gaiellaceae bacterium]|nr:histidine kinase [Gaiellaceae bacterium]